MRVVGLPRSFYHAAKLGKGQGEEKKAQVRERLLVLKCWQALRERGCTATEASEEVGIAVSTLYRWQERLGAEGPGGLADRSRRPKRARRPLWSVELVEAILALRRQCPRWGKDKLVVLLRQEGHITSASTVGRVLSYLSGRGLLEQRLAAGIQTRRRLERRPYATRKPKDYAASEPGDLVEVDVLEVRPRPGMVYKHFGARDVVSRWDVLGLYRRATASTAARFLDVLIARSPFPIRAVQVDGGSEFHSAFEEACRARHIRLFVLPPRSPKLNGSVERAHRTHKEEFYQLYSAELHIQPMQEALRAWERTYNTFRPHQALDNLTPLQYIRAHCPDAAPALSHMS